MHLNTGISNSTIRALSPDALGPYLKDTAEAFGSETTEVLQELGIVSKLDIDDYTAQAAPESPLLPPQYLDLKSERFYGSMAKQTAPGRNGDGVVLTWILSQVNAARVIVPTVAERNEVTAFKIGFVILFHAALSLQWLLDKNRGTLLLHQDAVQHIKSIVVAGAVRSVRKKSTLRNHLFHYDLKANAKKRIAPLLVPHLPLCGLVEAHTSGKSLSEIAQDVDRGLDLVSNGLRALLPQTLTPR